MEYDRWFHDKSVLQHLVLWEKTAQYHRYHLTQFKPRTLNPIIISWKIRCSGQLASWKTRKDKQYSRIRIWSRPGDTPPRIPLEKSLAGIRISKIKKRVRRKIGKNQQSYQGERGRDKKTGGIGSIEEGTEGGREGIKRREYKKGCLKCKGWNN